MRTGTSSRFISESLRMNISTRTSRIFRARTRSVSRRRFLSQAQTQATSLAATIFRLARCSSNADIRRLRRLFSGALYRTIQPAPRRFMDWGAFIYNKKKKEARESFERALKLQASYPGTIPNAWNNLGILSAREGDAAAAIDFFQRALQIDPAHLIALVNLGNAYRQQKEWGEAKKVLQRALEVEPDDPEVNYSLGMVCAQLDESDRAYEYLKRAVELRPVYPEALNNLGVLHLRTRRPEEAIHSFEESIRVAPDYDQSYLNLARVYAIQGQREKAREVLLELLKEHPDHAQAKAALSQLTQ